MKFTQNAQAALGLPDTKAVSVEMTPELKRKYATICAEIVHLLKAKTDGPIEAYVILQFVQQALEEMAGIRGGIIVENDDAKH